MKKLFFSILASFVITITMAQVPQIINYQAVARNAAGQALANQSIKVRLTIHKNNVTAYSETRQVTTNTLGLFNVQIGSAGAFNTIGAMNTFYWLDNAAPGYALKVELDVNNSGFFTDMGSQQLVSVPYALAARDAINAVSADFATQAVNVQNIMNKVTDQVTVPVAGDRLAFDGTKWTTVKKDTVFMIGGGINAINPVAANPWQFAGPRATITVTGNETIVGNFSGAFGHGAFNNVAVSIAVCYKPVGGSVIESFDPAKYIDATIVSTPVKTQLSAQGAIKLPAGTYEIGLGIKNKSAVILNTNDNSNGTIEIRY